MSREFLTSRPIGELNLAYVLLPDYVTDTDPIELFAYSDYTYTDIIFEESKENGGGLVITKSMLQPGTLDLVEFVPSSYFSFVKDVTYTVSIRPAHDCLPSHRIVLKMPENLKFDPIKGCTVTYTAAVCKLLPETNELILSQVFAERTPGGSLLKFVISFADNPIGARYAGDWGARTEGIFDDGKYYIVDGNSSGYSFFAKPGYIKSTLGYTEKKTFMEGADADFTFETEHDIPVGGQLRVSLPVEMAFPPSVLDAEDPSYVMGPTATGSTDELIEFTEVTERYLLMTFPDGHLISRNPIELQMNDMRTPRSFRPSSEFLIETISDEGYVIDAGGTDITVTMDIMNTLTGLEIVPQSLINGAVTDYLIRIDTFVFLKDEDKILITNPPTVSFGPDGISCGPSDPEQGVTESTCEVLDVNSFAVSLSKVT